MRTNIALLFVFVAIKAMAVDLTLLDSLQRRAYLLEKSKEVVMTVKPDCYREFGEPEISGPCLIPELYGRLYPQLKGREYYEVTRKYDSSKEHMTLDFSSRIGIWSDNGTVMNMELGYGFGMEFIIDSFDEWLEKQPILPIPDGPMENFYYELYE